ncbi:unnamed protein product, partial [Mesorhabditis spiculigera]
MIKTGSITVCIDASKQRFGFIPEESSPKRVEKAVEAEQGSGKPEEDLWQNSNLHAGNHWGFDPDELSEDEQTLLERYRAGQLSSQQAGQLRATTPQPEQQDPNRRGLLKDVGDVNVGFGVGVGPYASVSSAVGVQLGGSGPAGGLPDALGYDIFPRQGERWTMDDYTGNKDNIVPDRWRRYWEAVSEGRASPPPRYTHKDLVGVNGNVGIGLPAP